MYYVYTIYSVDYKRYYVGKTDNLKRRLTEHNLGKTISTKSFRSRTFVLTESFETRSDTRIREKYLKSAAGRRWRKQSFRPPVAQLNSASDFGFEGCRFESCRGHLEQRVHSPKRMDFLIYKNLKIIDFVNEIN